MSVPTCECEQLVINAVVAGSVTDEIGDHVGGCEACAEAVAIFRHIERMADCTSRLPSPECILWRAQIAERNRLAARSTHVIEVMRKLAVAALMICLAALCAFAGVSSVGVAWIAALIVFACAAVALVTAQSGV